MRVIILARKNLQYNTRVERQAKTLVQAGHQVQIVTLQVGDLPSTERKDGYEIIRLKLDPLRQRLSRALLLWSAKPLSRCGARRQTGTCPSYGVSPYAAYPDRPTRSGLRSLWRPIRTLAKTMLKSGYRGVCFLIRPFAQPFTTLDFTLRAYRLLKDRFADAYQAHDSQALLVAYYLARRHQARFIYDAVEIVTERSAEPRGTVTTLFGKWAGRVLEGFLARRSNLIITPTPVIADVLRDRYKVSPELIMNCTWYRRKDQLRPPNGLDLRSMLPRSPNRILFYSGAISAANGIDYLIRCVRYLPRDVGLVLMGPMQRLYKGRCHQNIQAKGVQDRVFILDPVPPHQVPCYAATADVGIVAYQAGSLNNYATLPNKFFEYIMARLPIVAANFPALRAIITEENIGRLYEPSNVEDMARAVLEILEADTYEQLKINLEHTALKYTWEGQAEKFVQLYESLLGERA